MKKVIIVGSVALDSISSPFGKVERTVGGSAIYASLSASLFSSAGIVGVVGRDFPKGFLSRLKRRKIDASGIKFEKGKTFFWRGKYSWDLNTAHTLDTQLNVFANFKAEIPSDFLKEEFLFLANIDPVLQLEVLKKMKKSGGAKFVAGDTMNFWIERKKKELKKVISLLDVFLLNEAELRQFTGEHNILKGIKEVFAMSKNLKGIVVKRGEYGTCFFMNNRMFFLPAFPLEDAVDPTGAGDSFAGAFMGWLASRKKINWDELKKAIVYGTIVASFTVSGFGTKALLSLKKSEISKRYRKFAKMVHFEKIQI